jgi:hypothetical protein
LRNHPDFGGWPCFPVRLSLRLSYAPSRSPRTTPNTAWRIVA